jgi:xanthine dehydrogenase accessory factor
VISTAQKALQDGQPRLIRVSPTKDGEMEEGVIDFGMTCHSGGTLDIFLEPFTGRPSLLIIGAAPSAQALSALAHRTGLDVFAAAPGADAGMFPDARQVIDGLDLSGLSCGTPRFVVVATQGKRDEPGLEAALGTGAAHIAFIASGRKAEKLRTYLRERGQDPARVDAIVAPAGVEIGAVTPEEIALSVLAGIVKARRRDAAGAAASAPPREAAGEPRTPPRASVLASPDEETAVDPVCGMTVDVATAEFRSDHRGKAVYFCCGGCQHSFEKEPEKYLPRAEAPA